MKYINFTGVFSGKPRSENTGAASSISALQPSSSSSGPAPKAKAKGRPKKETNPEDETEKEIPYPGPEGRPKKEPVNPNEPESTTKQKVQKSNQKVIEQTGAPLLHYNSKSEWEK
jgi:hypothetical protein